MLHVLLTLAACFVVVALLFAGPKLMAPHLLRSSAPAGDEGMRRGGAEEQYVAAVKKYLAAARDLAELLSDLPDSNEYKARLDASLALYDRIGDAPAGLDPHRTIDLHLAELRMKSCAGQAVVARGAGRGCELLAAEQQRRIARVESLLRRVGE